MNNANTPKPEYYMTKKGEKAVRYVPPGGLVCKGAEIVMPDGAVERVVAVLWSGSWNGYHGAIVSVLGEERALRGDNPLRVGDQLMANGGNSYGDLEVIEVSDFVHNDGGKRGPYTLALAVGP